MATISYSAGYHSVQEGYKYTRAGDVATTGIGLDGINPFNQGALMATYTYDNEGQLYSLAYAVADTSIGGSLKAQFHHPISTKTSHNSRSKVTRGPLQRCFIAHKPLPRPSCLFAVVTTRERSSPPSSCKETGSAPRCCSP